MAALRRLKRVILSSGLQKTLSLILCLVFCWLLLDSLDHDKIDFYHKYKPPDNMDKEYPPGIVRHHIKISSIGNVSEATAFWFYDGEVRVFVTPPPKLVARIDTLDRKPYLFVFNLGRFGNLMFQFASMYGIAQATNRTPALHFKAWSTLRNKFKNLTVNVVEIPLGYRIESFDEEFAGTYDPQMLHPMDADAELCCYLQSYKYFEKYEKDLRQQFVFEDEIYQPAQKVLRDHLSWFKSQPEKHSTRKLTSIEEKQAQYQNTSIRQTTKRYQQINISHSQGNKIDGSIKTEQFTIIGVHIRRGDVAGEDEAKRGYKAAPASYFLKAMDYFRKHYDNTLFIVCGDEIEWNRRYLNTTIDGLPVTDVIFNPFTKTDFAMLSMCNHSIISVGSFGWWTGWLTGGTVVYYRDWPTPNTEIGYLYNREDYFPPHWIGLGD